MKITQILAFVVAFSLLGTMAFGQIKVVAPNGDTGIGTANPTEKLHVLGNQVIEGDNFAVGLNNAGTKVAVQVGKDRTTGGTASFELVGDLAFPNWGVQFNRFNSGFSSCTHRGTNVLQFNTVDGGNINLSTSSTPRIRIDGGSGDVGIGTTAPTSKLSVNGSADKPGGGDWGMFSDRKLKTNINPFKGGLAEVLRINPVTYNYNGKANILDTETEHVGIIAQEMQQIAPYMVSTVSVAEVTAGGEGENYTETRSATNNYLHVDATAIRYMLVNAVKEQQEMIDNQSNEIAELKEMVQALIADKATGNNHDINQIDVNMVNSDVAVLKQNVPNPFNGETSISYFIPESASIAKMLISDSTGKVVETITISDSGSGQINVAMKDFAQGTYFYTLFIDGETIGTKQMIQAK